MATDLYQGWDHRWLGTATLDWTATEGARSVSFTTGRYCHLGLTAIDPEDRRGTTIDLGFEEFAPALVAAMDAVTADNHTITWDPALLRYTFVVNGNFPLNSVVATGNAARETMRRLLGITANGSYTASDMRPWYVVRAEIDGRSNYDQPAMPDDVIRTRRASDGSIYSIGPTLVPREASWELRFEEKKHVQRRFADADSLAAGASWTYEDFLEHAAKYSVPCVIRDSVESMVFQMDTGFSRGAFARSRPDMDPMQIVKMRAASIRGYL
jgi:hypothetical protein